MSYRLRRAARVAGRAYDEALKPVGLRNTQFTLLGALEISGAQSINALAALLEPDATTLNRNLNVLERRGLVRQGPEMRDGRVRTVEISEQGRTLYSEALPLWTQVQSNLVASIGKDTHAQLLETLRELEGALDHL